MSNQKLPHSIHVRERLLVAIYAYPARPDGSVPLLAVIGRRSNAPCHHVIRAGNCQAAMRLAMEAHRRREGCLGHLAEQRED